MKNKEFSFQGKRKQQGVSLLELMVALALGLVLLMALAALMVTASRSSLKRSTAEMMDETARQVFFRLESDLREAGYIDPLANDAALVEAFELTNDERMARYTRQLAKLGGDSKEYTLLGKLSGGKVLPLIGCSGTLDGDNKCTTAANSRWHSLRVAYQTVSGSDAGNLASTSTREQEEASNSNADQTCVNNNVDENHPIVVNTYFVSEKNGAEGVSAARNLRCQGAVANFSGIESSAQATSPLVSGVEQMVFRYLVTDPDATLESEELEYGKVVSGRSVSRYMTADEVEASSLGWAGVLGVEVCVVVASESLDGRRDISTANVQPTIPGCLRRDSGTGQSMANAEFENDLPRPEWDRREHRRYVRTILLPNSQYLGDVML